MRVQNGTSSPQIECAIVGRDWQEILQDNTEFVAYAKELGVEDDYWQQALGIDQTDSNESPEPPSPTEQQQDQATAFTRMSYSQAHHG
jgi:capsid protein